MKTDFHAFIKICNKCASSNYIPINTDIYAQIIYKYILKSVR